LPAGDPREPRASKKTIEHANARAVREKSIGTYMNGQNRKDIRAGQRVEIILKKDQRTGNRTVGVVRDVLTSAAYHSRGIKVRLDDGRIGRVREILPDQQ
jgi:uncharacterized repeat protein (TIGR03833 family)